MASYRDDLQLNDSSQEVVISQKEFAWWCESWRRALVVSLIGKSCRLQITVTHQTHTQQRLVLFLSLLSFIVFSFFLFPLLSASLSLSPPDHAYAFFRKGYNPTEIFFLIFRSQNVFCEPNVTASQS
ncbi:hypothetical protein RJT34_14370 [Clitoria ternatea]|uniref:Uncharacterized protein n=1 Tax=Clitoria ternatea TaxID=43366 RepID=A0AAN9JSV3_CLITE